VILKLSAILNVKLRFYQTVHCVFKNNGFQIARFKIVIFKSQTQINHK
jgi:hypothetical protein